MRPGVIGGQVKLESRVGQEAVKAIPPGPSDPKSMPKPRNATSGTPILAANATGVLAARTVPITSDPQLREGASIRARG